MRKRALISSLVLTAALVLGASGCGSGCKNGFSQWAIGTYPDPHNSPNFKIED